MGPTGSSRVVQIHPTRRCNLRCLHCYSSSGPEERGELPAALLIDALTAAAAEGYTTASVSGGEPLLYRPLRKVLEGARAAGLATTVTSNGMLLDERRLASLEGCVDLLAISLDGVPASHDRMRGDPRAFSMMASRLEGVRRLGIPFGFIFTLTLHNLHELEWVAGFALDQGAALLQIHPLEEAGRARQELSGKRPDDIECSYAFLVAAQLQEALADRLHVQLDLISRRYVLASPACFFAEGETTCTADQPLSELVSPLVIEADGTVVPLEYGLARAYVLGNLHQAPLAELAATWRQTTYPAFRRLCRSAYEDLEADEGASLANWYERVQKVGEAGVAQGPLAVASS
jgi:MoaA/NifB/PqqE/SkfB family radical SAM enzyme